jgi:hypothetical protein
MKYKCAFCKIQFDETEEDGAIAAMAAHLEECEEHPIVTARAELAAARAEVERLHARCGRLMRECDEARDNLKAARPRTRPNKDQLGRMHFEMFEVGPLWREVTEECRETWRRNAERLVAAALDAAPLPTGTGRPPAAGWYWVKDAGGAVLHDPENWSVYWSPQTCWAGPLPAAPWEGQS